MECNNDRRILNKRQVQTEVRIKDELAVRNLQEYKCDDFSGYLQQMEKHQDKHVKVLV